jgi:predicted DNA-binding transcriptional regulator AlpA
MQMIHAVTGKKAFSIDEFCKLHGISRATYYNLKKEGKGPREMAVNARKLISDESAADWRRQMEAAA